MAARLGSYGTAYFGEKEIASYRSMENLYLPDTTKRHKYSKCE
ncbi:hypothetical protein Blut17040_07930 [Blautia luti]|nr:hypothetical protein [Blautia luti]BEI59764.1 hypothetical protein Blut17040_07930 [Blautia luti]